MNIVSLQMLIDSNVENIIKIVNEFVENKDVMRVLKTERGSDLGKRQFSNLLRSCREAASVEEVKLLISYKVAKDSKRESWNSNCNGKSLGDRLIEAIEEVEQISKDIWKKLKEQGVEEDYRKVNLLVVEKLLGYLYWKGTVVIASNNN